MKFKKCVCCCLVLGAVFGCVTLPGCSAFTNNPTDIQTNSSELKTASDSSKAATGRDLTVPVENTFNPSDYSKHLSSYGISESIIGDSLEELSNAAEEIIQGRIVSIEYFAFEGRAHTKANVTVEKVISGSLQEGHTISVFLRQGYIPLSEQVAWDETEGGAKFEYTAKELANTIIEECELGEELAKVGDDAVFYLSCNAVKEMGGYARVNGGRGEFLYDSKNNSYERANTAVRDENKAFTLEQIEEATRSAQEGN